VAALKTSQFDALAAAICPGKRLGYSPYARNLSRLSVTSFTPRQVAGFGTSVQTFLWGKYDGSGDDIRLTPRAYHAKFVYDVDYQTVARERVLSVAELRKNAELAALARAYPGTQALVYRYAGKQELGFKDARELILVFQQRDGPWCLRGIAHSEDTT